MKLYFIEALLSQFNCQRQRNLYNSLNNPFFHSPTFKCQCIKNIHSRKSPPPFSVRFKPKGPKRHTHTIYLQVAAETYRDLSAKGRKEYWHGVGKNDG